MILRKPYALLIKHFKFVHLIFTLISLFLFLKCNDLLAFIDEYIANSGFIIESYKIEELFPTYLNLLIIFGIILNIIIAVLLKNKDKKITFYIVNIIIYVILFVGFSYTSSVINSMQIQIVDTRLVRALRDIFSALNIFQIISFMMYAFRATGFDFKKFNFTKDLIDLQIEETDNEEVEVAVDIDINKIDRNRRKNLRMLKYFYFENRFWCNIGISAFCVIITIIAVFSSVDKNVTYKQNQIFNTTNYSMKIEDVYITDKDKNGKTIEEGKSFVLVEFSAKKTNNKDTKFNLSRLELVMNDMIYHNSDRYINYFDDFGTIYTNQDLLAEYKSYFLIYRVDNNDLNGKSKLIYVDNTVDKAIDFNSINLNNEKKESLALNENKILNDTILEDYELVLKKFELNNKIKLNYKYCITKDNCISAVEYIVPTISTNYDKAILRLDGSLVVPEKYNSYVANMEMLLTRFGYLEYTIDGNNYSSKFLGTLKANKVKQTNTVYLEVKKEVLSAEKIVLVLKIRNRTYELNLKGGEA